MDTNKRICLARIAGAHGVKGLVKLLPYGENPSILETADAVFTDPKSAKTIKITLKNPVGPHILAEIAEITNREDALALKGTELYIEESALPALDNENTFYYNDLKGLKALDETGTEFGTIIAVDNFGAGDLLEIQPLDGGNQFYLPFTKENTGAVSLKEKTIIVRNLEAYRIS